MKNRISKILSNKKIVIGVYFAAALLVGIQSLTSHKKTFLEGGRQYDTYNNYIIFERSFNHLKNNQDLYALYPEEHWDHFKYTPTFSVFFGFFSILPVSLGLILWNSLNMLIILIAIYSLPKLDNYKKGLVLALLLLEATGSVQNLQSNALIAGLLILAFVMLEKDKPFLATLCLVFTVFIKLFGIVGFSILLLYPNKGRNILYILFWTIIFLLVPLIFINLEQYISLFRSYLELLINDHNASYGYSVMGWLHTWLSIDVDKIMIVGIGAIIFLIPFLRTNKYNDINYKFLILSSILVWVVIFNHKAEPATFVIAMSGATIWFINSEKNWLNIFLFASAFLLTSISPTDIFPKYIRDEFLRPYRLKALPCILIWFKIVYDLITLKPKLNQIGTSTS